MQLFGQRGVKATTMRAIADAVGVSPALIVHHFGSKDGLRDAVNDSVTEKFQRLADATVRAYEGMDHERVLDSIADSLSPESSEPAGSDDIVLALMADEALSTYLRRLFSEDDPAGHRIFGEWLAMSVGMLNQWSSAGVIPEPQDVTLRAAALMSNDLASFLLRPYLKSALGWDPLSPEGAPRWTQEILTLYSGQAMAAQPQGEHHV